MKNGRNILKFMCLICLFQILLTLYFILKVYVSTVIRPDILAETEAEKNYYNSEVDSIHNGELDLSGRKRDQNEGSNNMVGREVLKVDTEPSDLVVEIWAKAAIGTYLWEHILGGVKSVDPKNPTIYSANLSTPQCQLVYKEGPGLTLETVPTNLTHLVLVLNGRTEEKVIQSRAWIQRVWNMPSAPKTLLVILGNERCDNEWIWGFLPPEGPLQGVFLVYDDLSIDERSIFQWPLGVATYRQFPLLSKTQIQPSHSRKYYCNLQATNYVNSSRATLFSLLRSSPIAAEKCFVKERVSWLASESPESSTEYVNILLQSDLTLCPAGFNTETYRVYEAIAAGSVPVVEDTPARGNCDPKEGWRLLKSLSAPVIWVKSWNDLDEILEREKWKSKGQKVIRRKKLLNWYEWFKMRNRDRFLSFISELM